MTAIASIKLSTIAGNTVRSTSATVGINQTFDPERFLPGGIARWVDRSGGVALGYASITLSVRPPTKDSRVYKVSFRHVRPVLETIDPSVGIFGPKLAYSLQFNGDFLVPERATSAERIAFFSAVKSAFFTTINASDDLPTDASGTPLQAAIETLEDVY